MEKRRIILGLFVILLVVGIVWGIKKAKNTPKVPVNLPTPAVFGQIENKFNVTIPSDVEKIDLKKVSDTDGLGIATRKYVNGKFIFTVLADLPETPAGAPYQVWLEKDAANRVFLGNLRIAKGGFILDFGSDINYMDYKKVVVFQKISILEGSF